MSISIVMIIVYLFEMFISFCFFSRIYEKKKRISTTILIGLLLFVPSAFIFNLCNNEIINTTLFFVINFIYAVLCFEVSLKNAAIQSIILDALMVATECATVFFCSAVIGLPVFQYKDNVYTLVIYVLICKLLYFISSQIMTIIIIKLGHKKNNNIKHFLPLFIFPILTIVSSILFLFTALNTEVPTVYKITSAVVCILYIFASVFIFIYYQMLANSEQKISELESEKRLYKLNQTYLSVLEHQNNELQMMFHDTKHHYLALSNFEKIEDVRKYISEIYSELEQKNTIEISNNKMLDLIISKYIVACKTQGIKFSYEVKTANLDYIDDAELSIILNNLMDNALEAAVKSQEKQIELTLKHINNMDVLSVANSCADAPKHHNGQLITTKFDYSNHGFGTRIIKKHVKKNNGEYEWFYDENEHRFHSTILFKRVSSSVEQIGKLP